MILRSTLVSLAIISTLLSKFSVFATNDCLSTIDRDLGPKLSPQATIVHDPNAAPRYSSYHAPRPGTIVNVATENDVVETVKYCIKHNLKFLAQGGGHAWTTSFNIGNKDVIINMRGLNQVSVNDAKDQITFGGGAMVKEVVETAYQNQVLAVTPSCSCVGITGAVLGGGYTRFIGHYGMAVDNVLSFNFVTASGKLMTVTPESSPDLWWALRGAGANFGIVTSTTMKAYPPYNNLLAWMTTLVFTPDRIEALVEAISTLEFTKDMFAFLFFVPVPPTYQPSVTMNLWYFGSEADGREAYKALYDIGPLADVSNIVPYNYFNSMTEQFDCLKGQRKPSYGPGLNKLDAATLREIWNEYVTITAQYPGLNSTSFTVELFSTEKVSSIPQSSAAFPHRDVKIQTLLTLWYDDPKLDTVANNFGRKVRKLLEKSSGFKEPKIYVNYGIGDEDPKSLYGNSLSRLKILKKRWDPKRLFSQFNPIPK